MGSLAIIWKANRNCTRGTPVRWPPGLRLRDSWWGREETQTLCGRALAAAQPISYMYARSVPLPFFPLLLLLLLLLLLAPPPHGAAKTRRTGEPEGLGRGRKISCCYGDDRQRRSRAVCWAGVGGWRGAQCQLGNSLCGRCTCTPLCMASFRKCGACIT